MKRAALILVSFLAGCDLYWSQNPPPVCQNYGGGATGGIAQGTVRDPNTGACDYYGGGGGGGCTSYDSNGCCVYTPINGSAPALYGATCDGACAALSETACTATPGCHAEYDNSGIYTGGGTTTGMGSATPPSSGQVFVQCWDIEPLQPLEGGDCTQLDAFTCAQHDDCISIMSSIYNGGSGYGSAYPVDGSNGATEQFVQCAPEVPTDLCAAVDCGPGSTCQTQCYACDPTNPTADCMGGCTPVCVPTQTCATIDCGPGYTCGEACDSSGNCYPQCYPATPTDPGSCTGTVTCGAPSPLCPTNTTAGIANGCYTGYCIPDAQCGPVDPGSCDSTGVMCNIAPPACPANTVPGVSGGCWSGFCIPTSSCPAPACETIADEMSCTARPDCTPVYTGTNCTCTADGVCSCQSESFARCETTLVTTPPTPVPGPLGV